MTTTFILPFWIVLSFLLIVLVAMIWISVIRHQERKHVANAIIAVKFICELYFLRCLEKTILSLFQSQEDKSLLDNDPINIEKRLTQVCATWNQERSFVLASHLLRFNRGQEILSNLQNMISMSHRHPEQMDVFLLPDVIVSGSGNTFYRDLFNDASRVIYKEDKQTDLLPKTNDEAKTKLFLLFQQKTTLDSSSTPQTGSYRRFQNSFHP